MVAKNTSHRSTRRSFLKTASAVGLAAGLSSQLGGTPGASANSTEAFANVVLPPDIGQSELQVYVRATGHTLRGSMLDYWRANGASYVYGNPISEPFASDDGYYSQAFERGIFQYRYEFQDTEDPIMRLMPIGYRTLKLDRNETGAAGRRLQGGGDRQSARWQPLSPNSGSAQKATNEGGFYDEYTGHTVTGAIADWYYNIEGGFYLGSPISQALKSRGATIQYFEGGLLVRDTNNVVALAPLPAETAPRLGIDTTRVKQGGLPEYDESLFIASPNPYPAGDQSAPGRKWIEISLGQQQLWAYQGWTTVLSTYVSTGLAPNLTQPGLFHVRYKLPKQTMTGFTDNTGEVVSTGTEAPEGTSATSYEVKDVPDVMYFSLSAEALHGAYWHNNFGNRMSHGCVNLPLEVAAWMYGWAPLGTMVWIHD